MIKNTMIYAKSSINKTAVIGDFCIIGASIYKNQKTRPVNINKGVRIGRFVTIYQGSKIRQNAFIEDYCLIGNNVFISKNCKVIYGAKIYDNSIIGSDTIIGGFICENVKIGSNCRVFGNLLHSHKFLNRDWDSITEPSPIVGNNVFIGFGAQVIGGIKIGNNVYITAGAIVTKNIKSNKVVFGINKTLDYDHWIKTKANKKSKHAIKENKR